ncbi:MAG: potassium-transporting ATPase subunit KdpA [Acidimicrobiales bacterium]
MAQQIPTSNLFELWLILAIPFALTYAVGRLAKDRRRGWVVFGAMIALWAGSALLTLQFESQGNPALATAGAVQEADRSGRREPGGQGGPLQAAAETGET